MTNAIARRKSPPTKAAAPAATDKAEAEILFQNYFKSIGPRTYAAQVKRAGNGNHFVVLTEGKRDDKTGEIRKTRLFVFGEDFVAFFKMLHETAQFIRANPVPADVRERRARFWAKGGERRPPARPGRSTAESSSAKPAATARPGTAQTPVRRPTAVAGRMPRTT